MKRVSAAEALECVLCVEPNDGLQARKEQKAALCCCFLGALTLGRRSLLCNLALEASQWRRVTEARSVCVFVRLHFLAFRVSCLDPFSAV